MKSLSPTKKLLIYDALFSRKKLTPQENHRYDQLLKGFKGEKKLEKLFHKGNNEKITALFSCLYEHNSQEFQIDCTLITSDIIYLLEVKNYSGNYSMRNNSIYYLPTNQEINNPINQLTRTEILFKNMLSEMKINMQVRSFIVFVNRNFVLYNVSEEMPIILPPQIERFFQKTNENAYAPTDQTTRIAERLLHRNKQESTYERRPKYEISECRRGLFCMYCHTVLNRAGRQTFGCGRCNKKYNVEEVVLYAVAQYHLLFPEKKIRVEKLLDWCGDEISDGYMRRILTKHLRNMPKSRYSYYYFQDKQLPFRLLSQKYK